MNLIATKKKVDFNKIYLYLSILFAFTMPLSRASISLFIILLPLIWIIEGDFKRKLEIFKSNKVLITLAIFLTYSAMFTFVSNNTEVALNILRLYSYFLVIFVLATSIKKSDVQTIISAFLLGMFISEIIAYGVFFELFEFGYATVENPSPFMMHIDYSVFMGFTSLLLLSRIFSNSYTTKEKIFFIFFFLTVTGNLFLSIGRTGQVALFVGIIVMSIIHFRLSLKSILISTLLLLSISSVAYQLSNTFKTRVASGYSDIEKISTMNLNSSWGIRVAFWIITYDILKEHPLGIGLGDYKDEIKKMVEAKNYTFLSPEAKEFISDTHPHNQYLMILLQTGVIGLFMFLYLIYQIFRLPIKDKEIKELSILFATIYFVSCIAEPLFIKQFTIAIFILFIGLFSAASNQISRDGEV